MAYAMRDFGRTLFGGKPCSSLRPDEFWAVDDVSFSVEAGDSLALIGRNGAGKTTLLRVVAGLIDPDMGSCKIHGRLVPLLALGAGFNPVLTGRENIVLNMALLGVSRSAALRSFDDIVEFADIGDGALDAPVRTYSSGMAARLGFSCAVHARPDILLLDEVLAVGDMAFRTKCYRRLGELRRQGTAFVLVSHNSHLVASFCKTALYLEKGRVKHYGDVHDALRAYEGDVEGVVTQHAAGGAYIDQKDLASSAVDGHIQRIWIEDEDGTSCSRITTGAPGAICVELVTRTPLQGVSLVVAIKDAAGDGQWLLILRQSDDSGRYDMDSTTAFFRLNMAPCTLCPRLYIAKIYVEQQGMDIVAAVESFKFAVTSSTPERNCVFHQPRSWDCSSTTPTQDRISTVPPNPEAANAREMLR